MLSIRLKVSQWKVMSGWERGDKLYLNTRTPASSHQDRQQTCKPCLLDISNRPSHAMYGRPYFLFQISSFSSKHLAAIISDWPPTCIVRQGFTVTTVPWQCLTMLSNSQVWVRGPKRLTTIHNGRHLYLAWTKKCRKDAHIAEMPRSTMTPSSPTVQSCWGLFWDTWDTLIS